MRKKSRNTRQTDGVDRLLSKMPDDVVIVSIIVLVVVTVMLLIEVSVAASLCRKIGYMFKIDL